MTPSEALQWTDQNCRPEAAQRLRSRAAAAALASEVRKLTAVEAENVQLRAFAQKMLNDWPDDFGDVDGCTIQDAAIECGLLAGETRHEPCGEHCNCAGYHDDMSDGVTCYRKTPLLTGDAL